MNKSQEQEVGTSYTFSEPPQETVITHVGAVLGSFAGEVALQAKLAVFDSLNHTDLRQTRNELLRIKRIEDKASAIGLIAVNK